MIFQSVFQYPVTYSTYNESSKSSCTRSTLTHNNNNEIDLDDAQCYGYKHTYRLD